MKHYWTQAQREAEAIRQLQEYDWEAPAMDRGVTIALSVAAFLIALAFTIYACGAGPA